jgi:hypothetical protein
LNRPSSNEEWASVIHAARRSAWSAWGNMAMNLRLLATAAAWSLASKRSSIAALITRAAFSCAGKVSANFSELRIVSCTALGFWSAATVARPLRWA